MKGLNDVLKAILLTVATFVFCVGITGILYVATTPDRRVQPITFQSQVQESIKSVVHISCPHWQGSGFVISEHIIATARHVVEGVEDFEIIACDGKKYRATRAISDKKHDVGFIWVDEKLSNPVILGSVKECYLGEDVYVIGSPYGMVNFNSLTKGIISGLNRNWDEIDLYTKKPYGWKIAFTTDSAGHPGNSGCPIFTMDGKVRGILVGGFSPVLICAMPCDLFIPDIKIIQLKFLEDKYQFERIPKYSAVENYYKQVEEWGR